MLNCNLALRLVTSLSLLARLASADPAFVRTFEQVVCLEERNGQRQPDFMAVVANECAKVNRITLTRASTPGAWTSRVSTNDHIYEASARVRHNSAARTTVFELSAFMPGTLGQALFVTSSPIEGALSENATFDMVHFPDLNRSRNHSVPLGNGFYTCVFLAKAPEMASECL